MCMLQIHTHLITAMLCSVVHESVLDVRAACVYKCNVSVINNSSTAATAALYCTLYTVGRRVVFSYRATTRDGGTRHTGTYCLRSSNGFRNVTLNLLCRLHRTSCSILQSTVCDAVQPLCTIAYLQKLLA
jgi:hypothetical protein